MPFSRKSPDRMLDVIEGRFWAIQAFLLDRLRNLASALGLPTPNLWRPKAPCGRKRRS